MTTQTTRLALLTMLSFGAFACDGATEDTAQTAGGSTTIEAAASRTVGPTEVAVYSGFYGDDDANAVRTEWRGEISVTDGSARIMDTFGFDTDGRVAARSRDFIEFASGTHADAAGIYMLVDPNHARAAFSFPPSSFSYYFSSSSCSSSSFSYGCSEVYYYIELT